MPRLKCPYCGEPGAFLDPETIQAVNPASSVSCKNPFCCCYDPIVYGYHPFMATKKKEEFRRMLAAEKNESDFGFNEEAPIKRRSVSSSRYRREGEKMGEHFLKGKKILVVDDEPDIIDMLRDLLDMCQVESALDFNAGKNFLQQRHYDAAILDIMGVDGYGLLEIAIQKNIPALILTAYALSAEHFKKSIQNGAHIYLPKDKMYEITEYLEELIKFYKLQDKKSGRWFVKLAPFFDKIFESNWKESDPLFWDDFRRQFNFTRDELKKVL
jgi:CheY-like chemotaxis protein